MRLRNQRCLNAVGLGTLDHGAVCVGRCEEVVERLRQIGALAEADAVLLALFCVEADGVGEAVVAGAFADHRACHQGVDDSCVRGACGNFHQSRCLILDLGEAVAQLFDLSLAGGAGFDCEVEGAASVDTLEVRCLVGRNDDDLGVIAVCVRAGHSAGHFVGEGHAVPDAVNGLGAELHDLVVPVDLDEFCFHAEALCKCLCHVGVKADPFAVFVLIVHRSEVGDADDQLAVRLDIGDVAVSGSLGSFFGSGFGFFCGGCFSRCGFGCGRFAGSILRGSCGFGLGGACGAGDEHHACQQQSDDLFHSLFLLIGLA